MTVRRLPPLLRRAWYALNQAFRQRIAHLAITPDQFSILRWLSEGDPAGLTQRELTDLMASDPNTITSTVARMERAGLLLRTPHERDRRAHRVRLLAGGGTVLAQARALSAELQEHVLGGVPLERREQFLADLEMVAEGCASALEQGRRGEGEALNSSLRATVSEQRPTSNVQRSTSNFQSLKGTAAIR